MGSMLGSPFFGKLSHEPLPVVPFGFHVGVPYFGKLSHEPLPVVPYNLNMLGTTNPIP